MSGGLLPAGLGVEALDEAAQVEFLRYWHDLPWFAENAPFMVRDKETTELVGLKPNFAQRYVWARCWEMARSGRPVRVVLPKARQLGMTTWFLAHKLHVALTQEGREMYVLLHDLKPARTAYNRIDTMRKRIELYDVPSLSSYDTGRYFGFHTESNILVESVRKQGVGRSETLHHVHATELPSWDDPESVMDGIEESVPDLPNFETSIILESTSEGVGDWWYWRVQRAKEGRGQYILVFLPWWIEPAYGAQDPFPSDLRRKWTPGGVVRLADCLVEPLSAGEEALGKRILAEAPSFGMPQMDVDTVVRKLLWRRRKMENRGAEKFMQEYPADVDEGFRGTGRPVFVPESVFFHKNRPHPLGLDEFGRGMVRPAPHRFEVVRTGSVIDGGRERQVWDAKPSTDGALHVWKPYERGARYVIPGDSSSGQAADASAIHVLKVTAEHLDQVAVWHGHIGVKELAYIHAWLALQYGRDGLLVPESTGHGRSHVETLADEIRFPGMRLYQREVISADGKKLVPRYGFDMNVSTRAQVIEEIYQLLQTPIPIIRHAETLMEMEQFRFDDKGRADHPNGGHSDLLMSWGIGAVARSQIAAQRHRPKVSRGVQYESDHRDDRVGIVRVGGIPLRSAG